LALRTPTIGAIARISHPLSAIHAVSSVDTIGLVAGLGKMRAKTKPPGGFNLSPDIKRTCESQVDTRTPSGIHWGGE
jgi:hypothetical protein